MQTSAPLGTVTSASDARAVSFLGMPIGFIGLGSMGMSICNRMLCAGYMVKVWRESARKAAVTFGSCCQCTAS